MRLGGTDASPGCSTGLWVAGFHAMAALFHQFILKDGVLASMLPAWLLRMPAPRD